MGHLTKVALNEKPVQRGSLPVTLVFAPKMNFTFAESKLNAVAGGNIDLRGCFDEKQALFARDIPALLVRYAENVTLNEVSVS